MVTHPSCTTLISCALMAPPNWQEWFPAVGPYIKGILVFDTLLQDPPPVIFPDVPEFKLRPVG